VLRRLLDQPIEPGGVVVGADYRVGDHAIANDADATKLLIEGERALDIGKSLTQYNAYDTGAFLCHPTIFDALEASAANQDGSLSAGVGRLAREGHVRAFDIGAADWVDVDTAADARRARARLRATMSKPEDGFVARVVNRRLSGRVLTPMLLRLLPRVTANEVSVLGFAVALLAAGFFLADWPVAAGAMVALASILDGSDGEIARLKQQHSPFGAYFDAVLDPVRRHGDAGGGRRVRLAGGRSLGGRRRWRRGRGWQPHGQLHIGPIGGRPRLPVPEPMAGRR
jgi:1L-myo-inositol 1-phosphate cytidylyltransferase / CDP-L-myo-inositol myo-inositolphosphotransferase